MMTVAPSTPFASLTGQIFSDKQPTSVVFPISAGELRADQSASVVVGFAVVPAPGSTLSPAITKATGPTGQITAVKIAPHGQTAADRSSRQTHLFAQVTPSATASQAITVNVKALTKTTGDYIVQAYLAGDVDGDGTVGSNDLASMQAAYGSREGQANYNPADDINGDGRVGCIDRMLLTRNLGAHLILPTGGSTTPTVTAAGATPAPTLTSTAVPLAAAPVPADLVPPAAPAAATPVSTPTTPAATPVATTTTTVPVAVATPVTTTTTVPVAVATPVTTTMTTVPVAVATPVATTTVATPITVATPTSTVSASSVVPVAVTPTAATPVYYTPVYANGTTGYATVGTSGTTTPAGMIAAYPSGSTGTPVYMISQSAPTAGTTSTAAPVYIYGQPVVGGTTAGTVYTQPVVAATTAGTPTAGSTLFGGGALGTTTAPTTTATPVPVYLYGTPTYSASTTPLAVSMS